MTEVVREIVDLRLQIPRLSRSKWNTEFKEAFRDLALNYGEAGDFGLGGTNKRGGSIVITHDNEHWRTQPILVIPFHTPRFPSNLGGLPSIMELLAIIGGIEVIATLSLSGIIHSDCQGLIRKLLHPHVLQRNTPPATLSSDTASQRSNNTRSGSSRRAATRNGLTSHPTAGTSTNGASSSPTASPAPIPQTTTPTYPFFIATPRYPTKQSPRAPSSPTIGSGQP